jgi:signal transduction histidine kinase
MSLLQRNRWFVAAAGITLVFTVVSFTAHKSTGLTTFADFYGLALMLAAITVTFSNAVTRPHERSFWALMTLGFALWASNQAAWTYLETIRHRLIPDPFFFDIILFFHALPFVAAIGWRPDILKKEGKIFFSVLNFLMLLGWWIFLYAFIVFPHQYVVINVRMYNVHYDQLYGLENILLLAVLALAMWTSSGGWRRLYLNFLAVGLLYAINSQFLDRAAAENTYYSGSPYDVPLIATICWMAATCWSAREWNLTSVEFTLDPRWKKLVPQLAMLAIVSLPVLGVWAAVFDHSPAPSRMFRIYAVLAAMFVLGTFVFLRQYMQDRTLMILLRESRRGYESQKRLQSQLVQKEKLASLGTLIAGAAQEIDVPLDAVMTYSEQLWGAQERLTDEQNALVRKIVIQAQRTRDLVADLLSFAQQAPGEKAPVDLNVLLTRGKQLMESRCPGGKIHVEISIQPGLPKVWGNVHQLFQAFIEIIENALDALQGVGGGSLKITAEKAAAENILSDPQTAEVVLQFSDTGPGIREPQRVFDPFYTTKPVGQGTGLGLSAVYGVVQDHNGHITCHNKPEGGALFVMRLPAAEAHAHAATTAGA